MKRQAQEAPRQAASAPADPSASRWRRRVCKAASTHLTQLRRRRHPPCRRFPPPSAARRRRRRSITVSPPPGARPRHLRPQPPPGASEGPVRVTLPGGGLAGGVEPTRNAGDDIYYRTRPCGLWAPWTHHERAARHPQPPRCLDDSSDAQRCTSALLRWPWRGRQRRSARPRERAARRGVRRSRRQQCADARRGGSAESERGKRKMGCRGYGRHASA